MLFVVEITEILTRTLEIDESDENEALEAATQMYHDEEIILDSTDFQEVIFNVKNAEI